MNALRYGIVIAFVFGAVSTAGATPAETCQTGLDHALKSMEDLPLMKEEMATGLMWLRLDAETALRSGDTATCLQKLAAVNEILGLKPIAPEG